MPRGRPHYRITYEDAERAHEYALTYGGVPGVLNPALIRSAIGRPYTGYYRPIHAKAAALLESMASNHGFADGNKRTCLLLVNLLLDRSGFCLQGTTDQSLNDLLEQLIVDAANGTVRYEQILAWMKAHIAVAQPEDAARSP